MRAELQAVLYFRRIKHLDHDPNTAHMEPAAEWTSGSIWRGEGLFMLPEWHCSTHRGRYLTYAMQKTSEFWRLCIRKVRICNGNGRTTWYTIILCCNTVTYVLLPFGLSGVWAAVWQWDYSSVWLQFSLSSWLWETVCSPSTAETRVLQPGILYQTRGAEERTPEKHGWDGKTLSEPDQTWSERKTDHYLLEKKWRRYREVCDKKKERK